MKERISVRAAIIINLNVHPRSYPDDLVPLIC